MRIIDERNENIGKIMNEMNYLIMNRIEMKMKNVMKNFQLRIQFHANAKIIVILVITIMSIIKVIVIIINNKEKK